MGSQSVINFSTVRMNRIQNLVKDYSPQSPKAAAQAREIGAAAIGTSAPSAEAAAPAKAKKKRGAGEGGAAVVSRPTNSFLQALSSPTVETAVGILAFLVNELETNPREFYEKYDISEDHPVSNIGRVARSAYENELSKSQAETDLSFAAKDAIPQAIIDAVARAFPREKAPAEVDRTKLAEAFKRVNREVVITAFLENVASALINQALDAARGPLPKSRIELVKRNIRERFVPEFIEEFKQYMKPGQRRSKRS